MHRFALIFYTRQTVTPPCLSNPASALSSGRQYNFETESLTLVSLNPHSSFSDFKSQSTTTPSLDPEAKFIPRFEKASDVIIDDYVKGNIDFNTAKTKVLKVDNVNLIDIDENNVDEALFYAKEDYWKKANAAGRSQ